MSTARSVPAGNGITWLTRGFATVRNHPGTTTAAVFLFLLALLVPVGLQFATNFLIPGAQASLAVQLLFTLTGLLVAALLQVGILRVFDSLERTGRATSSSIFATFGDVDLVTRTLAFALVVLAIYVVLVVVVLRALGPDMVDWYMHSLTQPMSASAVSPPMVHSPWTAVAIGVAGSIAMFGVNTFGYAQVALSPTSGAAAFMQGLQATARNMLPLLVNTIIVIGALLLLSIPMLLLMLLLGFIGGLVHPLAAVVLVMPVFLACLIAMCAVFYATMYHAWRDVFSEGAAANDPAVTPAPHQFTA